MADGQHSGLTNGHARREGWGGWRRRGGSQTAPLSPFTRTLKPLRLAHHTCSRTHQGRASTTRDHAPGRVRQTGPSARPPKLPPTDHTTREPPSADGGRCPPIAEQCCRKTPVAAAVRTGAARPQPRGGYRNRPGGAADPVSPNNRYEERGGGADNANIGTDVTIARPCSSPDRKDSTRYGLATSDVEITSQPRACLARQHIRRIRAVPARRQTLRRARSGGPFSAKPTLRRHSYKVGGGERDGVWSQLHACTSRPWPSRRGGERRRAEPQ